MRTDLPKIDMYLIQKYTFLIGMFCAFVMLFLTDLFSSFSPSDPFTLLDFKSILAFLVIASITMVVFTLIIVTPLSIFLISKYLEIKGYQKKLKFKTNDFWYVAEKSKDKYESKSSKIILFRTGKRHIRTYVL